MAGAWGDDPWRRHAYRWYDERGWTEHVSDGVNEALDQPGDRQTFAAPSAPSATSGPVWIETSGAVRVEPEPVRLTTVLGSTPAPRRWPLAVLGMIASFALGGWIFSGGDDDQPVGVAAVEDVRDTTVMGIDVPIGDDTPAVMLPTTTENTVPVATTPPPPVTVPALPPLSEADRVARNDGAIDELEKAGLDLLIAGFGYPAPTREELLAIGTTTCQLAATSLTRTDFEVALIGPVSTSGIPPLQWAIVAGLAAGMMCIDEIARLDIVPGM